MQGDADKDLLRLWEKDRTELLMCMPFLGVLAMHLDLVVGRWRSITTAATDGECIFANARFLRQLSAAERLFVLAHEVWHCAALHHPRRMGRDRERWNVAVDQETNAVLEEAGLTVPTDAILFRRYRGLSAEAVYERLPKRPPSRGWLADIHQAEGDDWPGRTASTDRAQDRTLQAWPQRVRSALQQTGLRAGDLPGTMEQAVHGTLRPSKTPWQQVLRQFIGHQRARSQSWSRPDRRHLARGWLLPGRPRDEIALAIAIDTSGSTRRHLDAFLGEVSAILRAHGSTSPVRLITFDAVIQQDHWIQARNLLSSLPKLRGGGGTDFRPVFERLAPEPPDGLLVLTDGAGPHGGVPPSYPVLWVLHGGGRSRRDDTFRLTADWASLPSAHATRSAKGRFPQRAIKRRQAATYG